MNALLRITWQKTVVIIGLGVLTACTQAAPEKKPSPKPRSDKPQVVATTSILCDMAKTIAASSIDLQCLIPNDQDPHLYQLSAANQQELDNAQIILYNGHGLEEKMLKAIQTSAAKKVAVAEEAVTNPLKKEKIVNPHVWHNALYGIKMAEVIKTNLEKAAPKNKATYTKNFQTLDKNLTSLHDWLKIQISTISGKSRQLVTSHQALAYYAVPYNIPVEGSVYGVSTANKSTPEKIAKMVDRMQKTKVTTVFTEKMVDTKSIEEVAKTAKVKVAKGQLYTDGLGAAGSEAATYTQMMEYNTKTIVENLNGRFTSFKPAKNKK